eukprot:CAMPEP_0119369132 /NCGR_PEP_ID=MMETSP1334-20130426/15700_1 /TAXON_ID=127549 /ORGANISM="Calcidiscus leptoporus, Strain RCC1130" /LENGTH=32 /DNA_ID= /DNA_START= /DNA_END= /DNA_ORIENTATION=
MRELEGRALPLTQAGATVHVSTNGPQRKLKSP